MNTLEVFTKSLVNGYQPLTKDFVNPVTNVHNYKNEK